MRTGARYRRYLALTAAAAGALALTSASALAGGDVTKHESGSITIAAGATRTLTVPYPDALKYAGARYTGSAVVLGPPKGAKGSRPSLELVKIREAQSVLGGSEYQARAHNANPAGTAAVRLRVSTTTIEPRV
jgi:hypothetical protein